MHVLLLCESLNKGKIFFVLFCMTPNTYCRSGICRMGKSYWTRSLFDSGQGVHFAAVCKKWLAALAQGTSHAHDPFRNGRKEKAVVWSISEGKIYDKIELPLPVSHNRKRWCGSGPFNQAMAPIPIWSCLPTVVLSALNPDSYVVLAIYDRVEKAGFIKGGHQRCECNYSSLCLWCL